MPRGTSAPASASAEITVPAARSGSLRGVTAPATSPTCSSAARAASSLSPTSVGTATVCAPVETNTFTCCPGDTEVPAVGSVRMTLPAAISVLASSDPVGDEVFGAEDLIRPFVRDIGDVGDDPGVRRHLGARADREHPEKQPDEQQDGEQGHSPPDPGDRRAGLGALHRGVGAQLPERPGRLGGLPRRGPVELARESADLALGGGATVDRRVERLAERGGILIALERVLGERPQGDGIQCPGHRLVDLGGGQGGLAHVLVRHRDRRLTAEGLTAGEQLVEDDAGRVEVGARVDGLALGLLRREVGGGAEDVRRLGDRRGRVRDGPGDAEVHHLDLPGIRHHHVARLDVAMDDTGAMGVLERLEDAVDVADRVGDGHGARRDDVLQQRAVDELHDDVRHRTAPSRRVRSRCPRRRRTRARWWDAPSARRPAPPGGTGCGRRRRARDRAAAP